ncbi:MAG: UDP-N-acetylglucosamine-peptide N-acetylglucosaminyltransferase [Rhizobiaceae bacterium]|nr:UDP-N-acetylglucosamine-peptide N-acetylglucosaminyltransferase [Rhizobiaceae bacterium]
MKFHVHAHMCDFRANANISVGLDVLPWSALTLEDEPEHQLQRSALLWKKGTARIKPLPLPARTRPDWARVRVGYFSSDFHEHATMFLMSGLFREHDRSRFDIFAYSYGTNRDGQYLQLMRRQVTAFRDVQASSDQEIVQFARADDLDIAIDLKGYTSDERSRLFRYRLAPVQINYLGYPGSLGADEIEYIIADPTLITPELRQFYSERVIYLPHSYQPNDNWRGVSGRSTTRAEHGLPNGAFVFCCFNKSYKISVREFDIWMRLLRRVPGSVLWLIRTNPHAEQNLRKEAMARGIDPARLVFANKIAISEHLERHRHADLFLDTFNCNAHTTASDALWAGLPILTKSGRQFAARVGASLLTAVGLPQLIAETEEEYEQKALALALQPRVLNAAKARLAANRSSCPLFDTVRYTRNFEQGLLLAHERYRSGQKPADIFVQDAGDISPARTVQSSVP